MDASQRSFMSPRDRKALAEKEDRSFMRDLTQDKLASAERVAESQAKGMMGKANAPEKIRVPMVGPDGNPMYDKAGRAIMQDVVVDPAQEIARNNQPSEDPVLSSLDEQIADWQKRSSEGESQTGFMNILGPKTGIGRGVPGKIEDLQKKRDARARELEAGRYAAGAAPQQQFDGAVRRFTAGEGRAPTAQERADLRKRFGLS